MRPIHRPSFTLLLVSASAAAVLGCQGGTSGGHRARQNRARMDPWPRVARPARAGPRQPARLRSGVAMPDREGLRLRAVGQAPEEPRPPELHYHRARRELRVGWSSPAGPAGLRP